MKHSRVIFRFPLFSIQYVHVQRLPALLISMSICFSVAKIFSAKRLTESSEARSKDFTTTLWPVVHLMLSAALSALVISRQAMITLAPKRLKRIITRSLRILTKGDKRVRRREIQLPLLAKSFAVSFPIPELAPVMMTVFPVSFFLLVQTPPDVYCLNAK